MRHGRRKPYTQSGISRIPCVRCSQPAHHQWQVCADNRLYRPLCLSCDFKLNRLVLKWVKDPDWEEKCKSYEAKQS